MANIRDLKKDIKYMIRHLLDECYTQLAFSPHLNQENVLDIISDVLILKQDTIRKLNNKIYKRSRRKERIDYNLVSHEFYDKIVELTERLNSLDY